MPSQLFLSLFVFSHIDCKSFSASGGFVASYGFQTPTWLTLQLERNGASLDPVWNIPVKGCDWPCWSIVSHSSRQSQWLKRWRIMISKVLEAWVRWGKAGTRKENREHKRRWRKRKRFVTKNIWTWLMIDSGSQVKLWMPGFKWVWPAIWYVNL